MRARSRGKALGAALGVAVGALALACAHPVAPERAAVLTHESDDPPGCAGVPGAAGLRWPLQGRVTSVFGEREGRQHRGIDIAGRYGMGIRAAAAGTVAFSGHKAHYGRVVIVDHPAGVSTVYAHNEDLYVYAGLPVERGQVIAEIGSSGRSTGPHLHFEVRIAEHAVDPLGCLPPRQGSHSG
jgi:murein DD-endopeptidase MepM/ murein hydrolase activator NlpD